MSAAEAEALPELAKVHWRRPADEGTLRTVARRWTISILAQTIPFLVVAALLVAIKPILAPMLAIALAFAWIVPELYAARGAGVVRRREVAAPQAEQVALGLLGDLLDHRARELLLRTGLAMERGRLGVWLVAEAGALLVRPGGRRVHCYCVRVPDPQLPSGDRVAHLLLALRTDEAGFATVANLAFSGARWRCAGVFHATCARPSRRPQAPPARYSGPAPGPQARRKFVPRANVRFSVAGDHLPMTRPIASSKVLLVADRRVDAPEPGTAPVRRYRLARIRFDSRPTGGPERFEHLKRVYE